MSSTIRQHLYTTYNYKICFHLSTLDCLKVSKSYRFKSDFIDLYASRVRFQCDQNEALRNLRDRQQKKTQYS